MDPAKDEQPRAPGTPRLDRRTITICVAIATVAAILSAVIALALLDPDEDATAGTTGSTAGTTGESTRSSGAPSSTPSSTGKPELTPADHAPDTELTRFDGSRVTLQDFEGQKLVVNFFSSTCVPCRKEMPALQQVHQRLGDDVTFLGVATQDDPDAAMELVDKTGVSYDLAQDREGELLLAIAGATFLPVTAFIAEDGTVMEVHLGELTEQEITEKISGALLAGG